MIRLHKFHFVIFFFIFTIIIPTKVMAIQTLANDDYIIILDQSASMREKVPGKPAQGYFEDPMRAYKSKGSIDGLNFIVSKVLKEGDYFALITFGNEAELLLSQHIGYEHEREVITEQISKLPFKDKKTDIIAGFDKAKKLLSSLKTPHRRKILVMLTDGIEDQPENSPFITDESKNEIYQNLRNNIHLYKWDVILLGIGEYTQENIINIKNKLGLPLERARTIKNSEDDKEISNILTEIVKKRQKAFVQLEKKNIHIKLKPDILGNYPKSKISLSLKSFFDENVEIILRTNTPLKFDNSEFQTSVNTLRLNFTPGQIQNLKVDIFFKGKRSEKSHFKGKFSFYFSEDSYHFYPNEGTFEVFITSWWEIYGIQAMIALVIILLMLSLIVWAVRLALVSEVRISVNVNGIPLAQPMNIKRKQTFSIANGQFDGMSIPAKGLSCGTAAKIKYLGKRKFKITAFETKIIYEKKEYDTLLVKLDSFFDLKDDNGKVLRAITISEAIRSYDDPFGGNYDNDSF